MRMQGIGRIGSVLSSIHAGQFREQHPPLPPAVLPFITISRQAGTGGRTIAERLVERLNRDLPPTEQPRWAVWDRDLLERAAAEQNIPPELIERMERSRPWLEQFLSAFSAVDDPAHLNESQVYRRVAATIRNIAAAGRAVIVGRGGVYATGDLPGGVHVRLIAPLEYRVARMAQRMNVTMATAEAEVRALDRDRELFHRRCWHGKTPLPDVFTIGLNTAAVADEQLVECVLPLVAAAAKPGAGRPITAAALSS